MFIRTTKQSIDPKALPLVVLLAHVTEEGTEARAHRPSDERFSYELFRRAIQESNDAAWAGLYQHYAPEIHAWVVQHPSTSLLLRQGGKRKDVINASFSRFRQELVANRWESFDQFSDLLLYLKMCVHTVIADSIRAREARQIEPVESESEPESDHGLEEVLACLSSQDLWQFIEKTLQGEKERVLVYLSYVKAMRAEEIVARNPHLFPTAQEVHHMKQLILQRLRATLPH